MVGFAFWGIMTSLSAASILDSNKDRLLQMTGNWKSPILKDIAVSPSACSGIYQSALTDKPMFIGTARGCNCISNGITRSTCNETLVKEGKCSHILPVASRSLEKWEGGNRLCAQFGTETYASNFDFGETADTGCKSGYKTCGAGKKGEYFCAKTACPVNNVDSTSSGMEGSKSIGKLGLRTMYKTFSAKRMPPIEFMIREKGICLDSD